VKNDDIDTTRKMTLSSCARSKWLCCNLSNGHSYDSDTDTVNIIQMIFDEMTLGNSNALCFKQRGDLYYT